MSKNKKDKESKEIDELGEINPDTATNTAKLSRTERLSLEKDMRLANSMSAVLIVVRGYPQGKRINLEENKYIIGRDPNVDICFNDKIVSSKHAEIKKVNDSYYINDCKSTNGIYVNNEKVKGSVKLKKEDMIKIGTYVLKYIPEGELETMYLGSLAEAANIDNLTQMFNRNYMDQALNAEFKRAKGLKRKLSLVVFDLDNFKAINDNYGHDMGDYVLTEISRLAKSNLRENEILGRYGGDEFVLILWDTSENAAVKLAEQIRKTVEDYEFIFNEQKVTATLSLGVAEISDKHKTVSQLYKSADEALYESKAYGRNRVSVSKPDLKIKRNAS